MLRLGATWRWVEWPEAGVRLELRPLSADEERELVEATTSIEHGEDGRVSRVHRDNREYARQVGVRCIRAWEGVVDQAGAPVPFDEERVREFMSIIPAQEYVVQQVTGLNLHVQQEKERAKNG